MSSPSFLVSFLLIFAILISFVLFLFVVQGTGKTFHNLWNCRNWRHSWANSHSIWARSTNFDDYYMVSSKFWKNLIIHRLSTDSQRTTVIFGTSPSNLEFKKIGNNHFSYGHGAYTSGIIHSVMLKSLLPGTVISQWHLWNFHLEIGTKYYYKCGGSSGWSETYSFETASLTDDVNHSIKIFIPKSSNIYIILLGTSYNIRGY